jgi:hypothetical protein
VKYGETEARKWLQIELEEPNGCAHTDAAIRWALDRIAELEEEVRPASAAKMDADLLLRWIQEHVQVAAPAPLDPVAVEWIDTAIAAHFEQRKNELKRELIARGGQP